MIVTLYVCMQMSKSVNIHIQNKLSINKLVMLEDIQPFVKSTSHLLRVIGTSKLDIFSLALNYLPVKRKSVIVRIDFLN